MPDGIARRVFFMEVPMKRYLIKKEVAKRYRNSTHTISAWVKAEYIPYVRCGRLIRFSEDALDEWDRERASEGRTQMTPRIAV